MLTFFRSFRQNTMESHRYAIVKYAGYALGEIILVMIGILLALQVNTWNTNRQNRIEEENMLSRLTVELKGELAHLDNVLQDFSQAENMAVRITNTWQKNNNIISDSLQYINDFLNVSYVGLWYNEPITWTQIIQTGDIKLIRDQELVDKLHIYYSNLRKDSENFSRYPLSQITEVRKIWSNAFMLENYQSEIMTMHVVGGSVREVPDRRVFDYIVEHKDLYLPLFTNLAYIYQANFRTMNERIKEGRDVLELLETKIES